MTAVKKGEKIYAREDEREVKVEAEVEVVVSGLRGEYEATDDRGRKLKAAKEGDGKLRVFAPHGCRIHLTKIRDTSHISYF